MTLAEFPATNRLKDTKLFFLEEDCAEQFGVDKGKEFFTRTEKRYDDLCGNADFKGNEAIEKHLTTNLFPTLAYYQALREEGFGQEDALVYVRKETSRAALIKKEEQSKTGSMPCAYLMYRLFAKSVMKKSFPREGWDTQWVRCDGKEIHFDMTRCLYKDTCDKMGCPELCAVFCENDDIAFSGLMPKIRFERNGTLGKGSDRCDFHFIKNQ